MSMDHLKMDIILNLMTMVIMGTRKEEGKGEARKRRERKEVKAKFTKRLSQ